MKVQSSKFKVQSWGCAALVSLGAGGQAQVPPMPPKTMYASPQIKGAQVQMQSAKTSFAVVLPPATNYVQIQFDVDPHNGTPCYPNFTTYLQTSYDFKTWRDIGSVSGTNNGAFAVPVVKTNQFFRTRWDNTQTR